MTQTIIDAHVHSSPFGQIQYRGSGAAYVRKIRKMGIHAVALLAPPAACGKAVQRFGDFVIPVPMYRLRGYEMHSSGTLDDLRADIERQLETLPGCRAIKFIAPLRPYSEPAFWPLYQAVLDRGATAVFHTGYLGMGRTEPEDPPTEITHMRAAHVDAVARRFPTLKILMAHYSNPWWEEAWKVTWSKANVYADMSGHTAIFRSMSMWAETFAPDGRLMEDSLAKLVFASDETYFHDGEHKFGAWVEFYERLLNRINAPARLRELVWSGNAKMLYGVQ